MRPRSPEVLTVYFEEASVCIAPSVSMYCTLVIEISGGKKSTQWWCRTGSGHDIVSTSVRASLRLSVFSAVMRAVVIERL